MKKKDYVSSTYHAFEAYITQEVVNQNPTADPLNQHRRMEVRERLNTDIRTSNENSDSQYKILRYIRNALAHHGISKTNVNQATIQTSGGAVVELREKS